jgi:hypothetical protein
MQTLEESQHDCRQQLQDSRRVITESKRLLSRPYLALWPKVS